MGLFDILFKKKCDILSKEAIVLGLENTHDVEVFESIDSTNTYLKTSVKTKKNSFTIAIADTQTNGKGRMGRSFYSPKGSGIYFSILLFPTLPPQNCVFLTTAACVAVARALKECLGLDTQIKWVNDIYCNGKKLCGILTESCINTNNGTVYFAVVGIGVNFKKNAFPKELSNIATSVEECARLTCDRNSLICSIINHFEKIYNELPNRDYMNEYRDKSFLIGKNVTVIKADTSFPATVIDINEDANLVVQTQNGDIETLFSGEVSLKLK